MKIKIISFIALLSITTLIHAQEYSTGLGVRGGLANGITVKHFLGSSTAVEGILTTRWQGFMITGLYEVHNDLDPQGLSWFYGGGGHIGFFGGYTNHPWFDDDADYVVIGVDGIIGLEYVFDEVPISLSLDWKPAFNVSGHSGFWADGGGFAIRYVIR